MAIGGIDPCQSKLTTARAPRILLVEDEFLVATLLHGDLQEAGWVVVGPFADLVAATHAARHETFDLAVLDVNLNGEMVYPLADELSERDIPFIFLSGYGSRSVPEKYRTAPRVAKPYTLAALIREINRVAPRPG